MKTAAIQQWFADNRMRLIGAALLASLFLLLQIDRIHDFGANLVGDELARENADYLGHAERKARDTFIVLSEVYAIMKVMQSGSVGISFGIHTDVTIGNALSSFVDLLERSIEVTLTAAAASASLKKLMVLTELLNPLLFKLALILASLYLLLSSISRGHWLSSASRGLFEIVLLVFLTTYLIFPYSIHATGWLNQKITSSIHNDTRVFLSDIQKQVKHRGKEKSKFGRRAEHALHHFSQFSKELKHRVEYLGLVLTRHIATALIEGIVLPLGLVLLLFYSLRRVFRQISQIYSDDLANPGNSQ